MFGPAFGDGYGFEVVHGMTRDTILVNLGMVGMHGIYVSIMEQLASMKEAFHYRAMSIPVAISAWL